MVRKKPSSGVVTLVVLCFFVIQSISAETLTESSPLSQPLPTEPILPPQPLPTEPRIPDPPANVLTEAPAAAADAPAAAAPEAPAAAPDAPAAAPEAPAAAPEAPAAAPEAPAAAPDAPAAAAPEIPAAAPEAPAAAPEAPAAAPEAPAAAPESPAAAPEAPAAAPGAPAAAPDAPAAAPEAPAAQPDTPAAQPETPAAQPDTPAAAPDTPAAQPDTPAAQPDTPAAQPDTPAAQPDTPAAAPDAPAAEPDTPAAAPDAPAVEPDTPAAAPDTPAVEPDTPAAEPDIPAAEPDTPAAEPDIPAAKPDTPAAEPDLPLEPEATVKPTLEDKVNNLIDTLGENSTVTPVLSGFLDMYKIWTTPTVKSASNLQDWFPCSIDRSRIRPKSVHKLRAGDFDVVGAMGDSITGGNGILADSLQGLKQQWRGRSWSIGGDGSFLSTPTIPNFIRLANRRLSGYSLGKGDEKSVNAHLNVAVAGATSADLLKQAKDLVSRLAAAPGIRFKDDWKLITLFIGGNDMCECRRPITPEKFAANIKAALDHLHANVPRVFVNLVDALDISNLRDLNKGLVCRIAHRILCPCIAFTSARKRKQLQLKARAYQSLTERLVASGRYDTRPDFTVVLQPFFKNTQIPKDVRGRADLKYFAPDCFHFSGLGHASAAEALWNNMVEPVGHKRTDWSLGSALQCPVSDFPFISTNLNSKGRVWVKQVRKVKTRYGLDSQFAHSPWTGNEYTAVIFGALGGVGLLAIVVVVVVRRRSRRGYQRLDSAGMDLTQMDDTTSLIVKR